MADKTLRHGDWVTLTPQNVKGMVPREGEEAWRHVDSATPDEHDHDDVE